MSKPKIRDLINHTPTDADKNAIFEGFLRGPPLVVAILGQAYVEQALDELLRTRFAKTGRDRWGELVGENGPFATFHAKIIAAHAFGLFDDVTKDHLNRIRNIRNTFAHAKLVLDFSHPLAVQEIRGAALAKRPHSKLAKRVKEIRSEDTTPDHGYRLLCMTAWSVLMQRLTAYHRTSNKNVRRASRKRALSPFGFGLGALQTSQNALADAVQGYRGGLIGSQAPRRTDDPTPQALRLANAILNPPPKKGGGQ